MEVGSLNGELTPTSGASRKDLVASLQKLHTRAGKPSLRALERWATERGDHPLARTTVSEMLSGKRMPSQVVLLTFVQACGVPPGELAHWQEAWERVSLAEDTRGASLNRIEHLRQQVSESEESLSRVIAGAEQAALESHGQLQKSLARLEALISEHQGHVLNADEKREESERYFMLALQAGIRQLEDRHREAERVLEDKMQSIGHMLTEFEGRMYRLLETAERSSASVASEPAYSKPSSLYEDSSLWGDEQDLSPPVIK